MRRVPAVSGPPPLAVASKQSLGGILRRRVRERNIEAVRRGIEAFNRRDFGGALAALRDDVTWVLTIDEHGLASKVQAFEGRADALRAAGAPRGKGSPRTGSSASRGERRPDSCEALDVPSQVARKFKIATGSLVQS